VTGSGAKKPPAAPRKRKKRAGPVSLHPLSFDDTMRALLAVPATAMGRKKKPKESKD
jgi:hypothetical protein